MYKLIPFVHQWRQPHMLPPLYGFFLTSGTLITFLKVIGSVSDQKNSLFLGRSLENILFVAGLAILVLAFIFLTLKLFRSPEWSRHLWGIAIKNKTISDKILLVALAAFLFCWIILFFPSYRLAGNLAGYLDQLNPLMIWVTVASAATMLTLLLERKTESVRTIISTNTTAVWAGIISLTIMILIGAIIAITGIGIRHPEEYWYAAGVPLLGLQILFSIILGTFFIWMERRREIKNPLKLDALLCIAIWSVSGWLWARGSLNPNYFMPDTAKNIMYPFSDSATFDAASQFALIGQGLFNGQYFDRALYSAFLTYLHALVGQNTEQLMTAQALVYSIFPMIIYLIGREIHSRALGISAACLILLRGVNAIAAATWIDLASPKMMLTDFPAAIGISLFILFILKWLKEPDRQHLSVWAGGMLGMTLMLRTHILLILPFLIIYMLISVRFKWKHWAVGSLLLIFGMLTATLPWDVRNLSNGTPMFYTYYSRIQLILRARYGIEGDTFIPSTPSIISGALKIRNADARALERRTGHTMEAIPCESRACAVANHYFHNLVTSVLFLPTSFILDDLRNTVKESTPYWKQGWIGSDLGITAGSLILVNLMLISLGIGAAWERNKLIGLLSLGVFLIYLLSNALAFTSGGRYITPVDWILCIYYILGILQVALWGLRLAGVVAPPENLQTFYETNPSAVNAKQNIKLVRTFAIVFLIGALIPLAEKPFERRFQNNLLEVTQAMSQPQKWITQANLTETDLSKFLMDPQAIIIVGRILYPRYYREGQGEPKRSYPYIPLDYPRLTFMMIGPYSGGVESVIIPGDKPKFALHAEDVIMMGCKTDLFLDALVVYKLNEPEMFYLRSPQPPLLQCPFPPPK